MAATRDSVFPSLVVFDLDECVWSPEMYTLTKVPTAKDAVRGQLPGGVAKVWLAREVVERRSLSSPGPCT